MTTKRAARGTGLTARGWPQEAALRMLHNNLDPEVAEHPEELVVYGGTGKAARDHASLAAIERCLTALGGDETLLVQSGKPVGVFTTHEWAPRVILANSNLVPDWATWDEFRRLEHLGLTMYGQMTAGSWIYIGTQGILQGTFETFASLADKLAGIVPDRNSERDDAVFEFVVDGCVLALADLDELLLKDVHVGDGSRRQWPQVGSQHVPDDVGLQLCENQFAGGAGIERPALSHHVADVQAHSIRSGLYHQVEQ
jgi:hypothetical protein